MQFTIIALGVALAVLVMSLWRARTRGANREHLEARCPIMGYWDRPFEEAVNLMNEWLARYTTA